MKKAIITGSTGLVGGAVARYLLTQGIDVLCLGRRFLTPIEIRENFGEEATYLSLPMSDINKIEEVIHENCWQPGKECVFYNFAWSGNENLTDGSFAAQINNAISATEAVKAARRLGCVKFINAGTLEETFVEVSLKDKNIPYTSSQTNYALAKLTARDMCLMVAYLEKIDYIHTRLSVPLNPDLSSGTYIAKTLKNISQGKDFDSPLNKQLFDIIFLDDVAHAYYLIGLYGKNKANYFIGTSKPIRLNDYFSHFERIVLCIPCNEPENPSDNTNYDLFDISNLQKDTGFIPHTNRFKLGQFR